MGTRKKEEAKRLPCRIHTRLTQQKYDELCALLQQTSGVHSLSELLRNILENKKIVTVKKDASLSPVAEQLSGIRKELLAIGNNINQVTRALHQTELPDEHLIQAQEIAKLYQQTDQKITELFTIISQHSSKWLPG